MVCVVLMCLFVHESVHTLYIHTIWTLSWGYNTCVYVYARVCASGLGGFVWPAVWRESLIPSDLVFLQLLQDQKNQLLPPGDLQDGPKPSLSRIFSFSFLVLLLLVTPVVGLVRKNKSFFFKFFPVNGFLGDSSLIWFEGLRTEGFVQLMVDWIWWLTREEIS